MDERSAKAAWVERVLGVSVPGGDSASAMGLVAYRSLLLRWRNAQSDVEANLRLVGKTLLANPEIQADPRLADIRKAVALLPTLVPRFGGALEDVLDAGLNATDPTAQARFRTAGIAAVDAYRQQLVAAKPLLELEQFAMAELGAGTPLYGALDQALIELKQQLAA